MALQENILKIYETQQQIRLQRPNMVDNIIQYKLAHFLILDCLTNPPFDEIPCDDNLIEKLQIYQTKGNLDVQMAFLNNVRWRDGKMKEIMMCCDAKTLENNDRIKNRFSTIVPGKYLYL